MPRRRRELRPGEGVRCRACGRIFLALSSHVYRIHGLDHAAYVKRFGASFWTALSVRKHLSETKRRRSGRRALPFPRSPRHVLRLLRAHAAGRRYDSIELRTLRYNAIRFFGSQRAALVAARVPDAAIRRRWFRWTRDGVLDALRAHAARGGRLTTTELPGNLAGAVVKYFGGFAQALRAAGLSHPSRPPGTGARGGRPWGLTRAQVIARIRARHRAGQSLRFVDARASESTLVSAAIRLFGNWGRARRAAGLPGDGRVRWDRAKVIAAIRARHRRGRSLVRVEVKHDDIPLWAAGETYFGGWYVAVRAAGLSVTPRKRRWTRKKILVAIRARACAGLSNRSMDVNREDSGLHGSAAARFGTWNRAVARAGLAPSTRFVWTRAILIEELRRRHRLARSRSSILLPHAGRALYGPLQRAFGSLEAAFRAARLPYERKRAPWTRARILEFICTRDRRGETLRYVDLELHYGRLFHHVKRWFGGWHQALAAAGLDPDAMGVRRFPRARVRPGTGVSERAG